MREPADADQVRRLAAELGRVVSPGTRMYLTDGATAVLEGWRDSTVDIRCDRDRLFRFPAVDPATLRNSVEILANV
jgi:hypothetical protein